MYAVIRTGGKQYRVSPGETIQVEKLDGSPGSTLELDEVLMLCDERVLAIGRPLIQGARVIAEVVRQDRDRKVVIFKYRRRKRYRRKAGHRQSFTELRINEIHIPEAPSSIKSINSQAGEPVAQG